MRREPPAPQYAVAKTRAEAAKYNPKIQIYRHEKSTEQWRTQNDHLLTKTKLYWQDLEIQNAKKTQAAAKEALAPLPVLPQEGADGEMKVENGSFKSELSQVDENMSEKSAASVASEVSFDEIPNRYFLDDSKAFCRRCKQRGHSNQTCSFKNKSGCVYC
jgi:hypothetical protein